jgi:undecaprenyl-diphosphatase
MTRRERRHEDRGRFHLIEDLLFRAIRTIARYATGFYSAFGVFLVGGALLAILCTWLFAEVAGHVEEGATQRFDDAVLQWMGAHRIGWIERSLLEITALGTWLVVMTMVIVVAAFLLHTRHRWSAFLLLFATAGGIVLNNILKWSFDRPRPNIFAWATTAASSSFPSGHAMSAAAVYGTIAFLLARLQESRWQRFVTITLAFVLIGLVSVSRLYLGVHYPSDVLGGIVIGLAWAGFCVAGLEAVRTFAKRYDERGKLRHEQDIEHPPAKAASS